MEIIKKFIPISLAIILLIPTHALAAAIDIRSCPDLQKMNQNLFGQYTLANDIDCKNAAITKIGSTENPFMGSFDGQGHTIANFSISVKYEDNIGLFGYINQAKISNVNLRNVNIFITEHEYTGKIGTLIGFAEASTISNVSTSGAISQIGAPIPTTLYIRGIGGLIGYAETTQIINAHSSVNIAGPFMLYAGGLVGILNKKSSIENSHATGKLKIYQSSGGLVGEVINSSVTQSYATGSVQGYYPTEFQYVFGGLIGSLTHDTEKDPSMVSECYATGEVNGGLDGYVIGGLVGSVGGFKNSYPMINNSFATGKVTGYKEIGGLVGSASNLYLTNSYSTGKVSGNIQVGGLVGLSFFTQDNIINSYWDIQTSGQSLSSGGTGKATSEMFRQQTYTNWDFQSIWSIHEGQSYPSLQYTHCTSRCEASLK